MHKAMQQASQVSLGSNIVGIQITIKTLASLLSQFIQVVQFTVCPRFNSELLKLWSRIDVLIKKNHLRDWLPELSKWLEVEKTCKGPIS